MEAILEAADHKNTKTSTKTTRQFISSEKYTHVLRRKKSLMLEKSGFIITKEILAFKLALNKWAVSEYKCRGKKVCNTQGMKA